MQKLVDNTSEKLRAGQKEINDYNQVKIRGTSSDKHVEQNICYKNTTFKLEQARELWMGWSHESCERSQGKIAQELVHRQ